MNNRLRRFPRATTLVLGATLTLFWVPGPLHSQPTTTQDRQAAPGDRRDVDRSDVASFDRFLDQHREIAEQVRKDPSLLDNRKFVESHPALQTYFRDNPEVRGEIRQDPNSFTRQADLDNRDLNQRDRDTSGQDRDADRRYGANQDRDADRRNQDRDADRRDAGNQNRDADHRDSVNRIAANFEGFLDEHREIGEQVRRDPSLLENQNFLQSHPVLQTYLQDNPGVREQLRQNPNAFMQEAELNSRDSSMHDRDPMHNHMADFGGFLGSHSDLQRDLSRNPSIVKDHQYVQDHPELHTYLNAHPDVRNELMANPQDFVHGAEQLSSSPRTGSSTNPSATAHVPKPNQPKQ